MGTLIEKIQYTCNAVQDIKKALQEKGYVLDGITLKELGDVIRKLETSSSGGLDIKFPDYDTTTNDYYCTKIYEPALNILTGTTFTFTDNVIQIEEEV